MASSKRFTFQWYVSFYNFLVFPKIPWAKESENTYTHGMYVAFGYVALKSIYNSYWNINVHDGEQHNI